MLKLVRFAYASTGRETVVHVESFHCCVKDSLALGILETRLDNTRFWTPASDRIRHDLDKRFDQLERDSITRWFMLRSADKEGMVEFCRGKKIGTGVGFAYEGQLRDLYCHAVTPCIEDTIDDRRQAGA